MCRSGPSLYPEYVNVAEISARIAQAVIIYSLSLTLTLSVTNAVSSILNIALRSFPRGPSPCQLPNSVVPVLPRPPGAADSRNRVGCCINTVNAMANRKATHWITVDGSPPWMTPYVHQCPKTTSTTPARTHAPVGLRPFEFAVNKCGTVRSPRLPLRAPGDHPQAIALGAIGTVPCGAGWRTPPLWRWASSIRAAAAAAAAHRLPRASISRWLA